MRSLETILENLGRAQTAFLSAADAVQADRWATRPNERCWSAGQLVAHLIYVERSCIAMADRILQHSPRHIPLLKRFHVPMAFVESRVIRRKAPLPVSPDAELMREKEEMLAELRDVRERTLAFIEETRGRDLRPYRYKHPFVGSLNLYEWFQFIASHEIRHTKQMKEIAANLPKAVVSLQK